MEENTEEQKKNVLKTKEVWIFLVIGILIGGLIVYFLQLVPKFGEVFVAKKDIVAKTKVGSITEKDLYNKIEKIYPTEYLLEIIDKKILENKYELSNEDKEEILAEIDDILKQAQENGYTEELFFASNGFSDKDDFIGYMELNHLREVYYDEYFDQMITQEQIETYYNENYNPEEQTLEEVKDEIKEILIGEIETNDPYITYKSLVELRKNNNLKFLDEAFNENYKEYCEQIGADI